MRQHLAVTAVVGWMLTGSCAAAELAPEQVIATTAAAVAEAIATRHRELGSSNSRLHALIDELLRPQFDLEISSRLILREHWTQATPAQRQRFVAAFYHYLVASYGTALLDFRYDTVSVLAPEEPAGDTTAVVHTVMKLSDGSTYHVNYYMRRNSERWRIVDVIAEGVSYVKTYRTDFGAEVRERGLDSLIERLERQPAQSAPPPK